VLARALTERRVALEHFDGDAFKAPATQQAMKLIDAAPFGDDSVRAEMGAEITIVLKDGRRVGGTIDHAVGHEAGQPLAENLLVAKFAACTKKTFTPQQSENIAGAIADLAALPDVRAFMLLLEPARRSARVAAAQ